VAEAIDNGTPTFPLDPPGWVPLGKVWSEVTNVVGHPQVALDEIWLELVSGGVRALRSRLLSEGCYSPFEPVDRTAWRNIGFCVYENGFVFELRDRKDHTTSADVTGDDGGGVTLLLCWKDVCRRWLSKPRKAKPRKALSIKPVVEPAASTSATEPVADAVGEQLPKRSRRRREQSSPQIQRAIPVLRRLYPEKLYGNGWPTREQVADVDLCARAAAEYERVEGQEPQKSRLGPPSDDTYLRAVGRR
jgi:hypothetical protein